MYTNKTKQVQAGIKFLGNKNVSFEHDVDDELRTYADKTTEQMCEHNINIGIDVNNERIWTSGGKELWSNVKAKGVKTEYISLNVTKDFSEGKEAYWSGGLAGSIGYDGSGKDGTWFDGGSMSYEDKVKHGSYLINPVKLKDSDGLIYGDCTYIENCLLYMEKYCDFNRKLLAEYLDFDYSEQGMQEDECINLDAEVDGDFWIHCNEELVKFSATKVA